MFLDHFDKRDHGYLTRLFRDAFDNSFYRPQIRPRKRAENLTEMLENLERDLEVRKRAGTDLGMRESILDSELEAERKAFARWVAKDMQGRIAKVGKLADLPKVIVPPTPKQEEWLRKFKKKVPATKAEASAILEQCFQK